MQISSCYLGCKISCNCTTGRNLIQVTAPGIDNPAVFPQRRFHPQTDAARHVKHSGRLNAARRILACGSDYFIIAAATFLNALTSASMCSSVYVGCVQKEIVESAREFAISQLNFV